MKILATPVFGDKTLGAAAVESLGVAREAEVELLDLAPSTCWTTAAKRPMGTSRMRGVATRAVGRTTREVDGVVLPAVDAREEALAATMCEVAMVADTQTEAFTAQEKEKGLALKMTAAAVEAATCILVHLTCVAAVEVEVCNKNLATHTPTNEKRPAAAWELATPVATMVEALCRPTKTMMYTMVEPRRVPLSEPSTSRSMVPPKVEVARQCVRETHTTADVRQLTPTSGGCHLDVGLRGSAAVFLPIACL